MNIVIFYKKLISAIIKQLKLNKIILIIKYMLVKEIIVIQLKVFSNKGF